MKNISELLKNCPIGMELDSTIVDNLYFGEVTEHMIKCYTKQYYESTCTCNTIYFHHDGTYLPTPNAKCVIFPKGKTTWEGFQRPFKDGDIVATTMISGDTWIGIFKQYKETFFESYCCLNTIKRFHSTDFKNYSLTGLRLATEEEKQKLFDAIKENGYKWNAETKTLEKLPKFKVGDVIQDIDTYKVKITEVNIEDECYSYESMIAKGIGSIGFSEQDDWKLVPVVPKFKVGDRIRHIKSLETFTVIHVIHIDNEFRSYEIQVEKGITRSLFARNQDDYELASVAIVPKFKVGDKIRNKYIHKNYYAPEYTIIKIYAEYYKTDCGILHFENQDNYELVPNKFDISTLKPFDKVLVRAYNSFWRIGFF